MHAVTLYTRIIYSLVAHKIEKTYSNIIITNNFVHIFLLIKYSFFFCHLIVIALYLTSLSYKSIFQCIMYDFLSILHILPKYRKTLKI